MAENFSLKLSDAYEKLSEELFWRAFHILGDMEAARDIVNDTYLETMLHRNWWDSQRDEVREKYLKDTCDRMCRTYRTKNDRIRYTGEEWDEVFKGNDRAMEGAVLKESMRQYMDELGEDERRILILRYFKNYEMTRIADEENTTVSNVHKRLSRSRQKLKKIMEKPLPDS